MQCHIWVHIKCNKINLETNKCLQKSPSVWYCIKCFEDIVSFGTFSNEELFKTNQRFKVKFTNFAKKHASPNQDFINQLNGAMDDSSSEAISSKYLLIYLLSAFVYTE